MKQTIPLRRQPQRRARHAAALAVALLLAVLTIVAAPASDSQVDAAASGQASRYVAIGPVRVLDTRDPGFGALVALDILSVDPLTPAVLSAAGVDPLDIEAVAINLTITQPAGRGFFKSWPTADPTRPLDSASALNTRGDGETIANFSIVPVGANGRISIQSLSGAHVIVDVQGVFERATSSSSGRFVPLAAPKRALDTRDSQPVAGGTSIVVDLNATVGVPQNASAAVISIVATNTRAKGHLKVFPGGVPPNASNVNYPAGNYTIAGSTIARLDNGKLSVFSLSTTDVIVDVVGYMTGVSDVDSSSGLFVAFEPERHYDSRSTGGPLEAGQRRRLQIAGQLSVPSTGVLGVASNLTMTNTTGRGHLVIYPSDPMPQNYSTVNSVFVNHSIANHAIVALDNGGLSVFSKSHSDFVLDISGYFLDGTVAPPPTTRRVNTNPAPTPEVAQTPVSEPLPKPNEGSYAYLQRATPDSQSPGGNNRARYSLNGDEYYGWNPCKPITYAVNSGRATPAQMVALNAAIRDVETASGFDFQFIGEAKGSMYISETFDAVDPRTTGGATAMALFGFSDPYGTPILAGGTVGIGGLGDGIDSNSAIDYQTGDTYAWIVRDGFAIADVTDVTSANEVQATFAHEIGHMVGLAHVPALGELMRPILSTQFTYGPGDKYGLWSIGASQCAGGNLSRGAEPAETIGIDVANWIAD